MTFYRPWGRRLLGILLLLAPLGVYAHGLNNRPATKTQVAAPIFQGITYAREYRQQPRPQLIHRVVIDLTAPGLKPWVTPALPGFTSDSANPGQRETLAQKTSVALQQEDLQLAINANFFFPFQEETPWKTKPDVGDPVSLVGQAIAQGQVVSPPEPGWPALCFLDRRATIAMDGICPEGTVEAVAGDRLLLDQGQALVDAQSDLAKPYPMVIAALDRSGQELQLIVIDGKQPFYSEGMTLPEAQTLLQTWQVDRALRLDGGGSTSLVMEDEGGQPLILNGVIQAKLPGWERPVANQLGFYASPLTEEPLSE